MDFKQIIATIVGVVAGSVAIRAVMNRLSSQPQQRTSQQQKATTNYEDLSKMIQEQKFYEQRYNNPSGTGAPGSSQSQSYYNQNDSSKRL